MRNWLISYGTSYAMIDPCVRLSDIHYQDFEKWTICSWYGPRHVSLRSDWNPSFFLSQFLSISPFGPNKSVFDYFCKPSSPRLSWTFRTWIITFGMIELVSGSSERRLVITNFSDGLNSWELKITWFVNSINVTYELHLIWFFSEELHNWVEKILQVISCLEASWFGRYGSNNEHISLMLSMIKTCMFVLPGALPKGASKLLWTV